MANIKSAKKRISVIETKTLRNKMIKSKVKTLIKKVEAAVAANDKAAASTALKGAHWLIRAVAALRSEFPDIELRIAAADGLHAPKGLKGLLFDQSYHAYLRRVVKQLNVENNIVA